MRKEFRKIEVDLVLSGKVVPIEWAPKMYVCMDGTGVPVVKAANRGQTRKGRRRAGKDPGSQIGLHFHADHVR